jgi:hypothetical protein
VELYYLLGNYTLMEKYCRILDKSAANGTYVRHFRALSAAGTPAEPSSVRERASLPVISHDPLYNLIQLERMGFSTPMLRDRLPVTILLRNREKGME